MRLRLRPSGCLRHRWRLQEGHGPRSSRRHRVACGPTVGRPGAPTLRLGLCSKGKGGSTGWAVEQRQVAMEIAAVEKCLVQFLYIYIYRERESLEGKVMSNLYLPSQRITCDLF